MPPRLSKRQQREQEELQALAGPSNAEDSDEASEEAPDTRNGQGASSRIIGFAALIEDDDNKEVEDPANDEYQSVLATHSKKSKKKKKTKILGGIFNEPHTPSKKSNKTRPMKQDVSKSKGKQIARDVDFEKALEELSGKHSVAHGSVPTDATSESLSSYDALNSLLSVSLKHLDPETELRRFFGYKVITTTSSSRPTKVRSNLVRPQQAWPPAQYRAGLSMRALTPQEVEDKLRGVSHSLRERWWTFEASSRYMEATYEYLQYVMSGDPEFFYNLLREMPWHADTLLQMAEVFRHREEYSTAADFLSRALFAYEHGFSGAFNLTSGMHRLDFDHVENRVFYLALARNVIDLNRRGTPRTAFEFARLLFSLDPYTDPHGALLHLDYLAIKARQEEWLLDMWDTYVNMEIGKGDQTQFNVTMLPGWHWSRALALFDKESGVADNEHLQSTQVLKDAIVVFPSIVPLLFDKIDLSMSPELRKIDAFKIVTDYNSYREDLPTSLIHLLAHIYATRSFSLWKAPERAAWLLKTLESLNPSSFTASIPHRSRAMTQNLFCWQSSITESIYRHVVVVSSLAPEFRRLTAFFPAEVTTRLTRTIEGDPLPPLTAASTHQGSYFDRVALAMRRRERNVQGIRRPDQAHGMHAPEQLRALLDMHPEIIARFREQGIQIDQFAGDFPEEVMIAAIGMLAEAADRNIGEFPAEERRMPGGGVEFEHEDGDRDHGEGADDPVESDDDEVEEEDEQYSFAMRFVRTLGRRLLGRTAEADESSGSDSDHEGVSVRTDVGPRPDDVD